VSRQYVGLIAFYAAVSAIMAAPFVNYSALTSASYEGDARLVIWILAWNNHAVLSGLSLFDSNAFYPARASLAYGEHMFGISLFTLPVYALSRNPVLAYNVIWLLAWLLNALCAHAVLKHYTQSHLSALAGSLVYTFSFYKMHHAHGHLQQVWTWLLPLSVLLLERWTTRPRLGTGFAWGLCVVLQSLSSWYLAVMTLVVQGIAALLVVPAWIRPPLRGRFWHLVLVTVMAAAVMTPFARPYRMLPPSSAGEMTGNSADLASYVVPPENTWPGQIWLRMLGSGPRWIWGERTVYLGWLALALGTLGTVQVFRRRQYRLAAFALMLIVLGFIISGGPEASGPVYSKMSGLPGLSAFRAPARFALVVLLGLSILVAQGANLLQACGRGGRIALLALLPVMVSEWYVVEFPAGKPPSAPVPAIYRTAEVRASRALVSLPIHSRRSDWWREADYLYYSTAHWRPIVNGYGRSEPPAHSQVVSHMMAFPGPNNARRMRELGVEHLVLHSDRYPAGDVDEMVRVAQESQEYDLVGQVGTEYLFRVRANPPAAASSRARQADSHAR
jgi:hypothetical protein